MARKSSSARQTQVSNGAGSGAGGTLATSVYDRMRHDILRGALGPGEKLRAEYLRERYQVGNSPVREALNRLSADGLVVREDQKGFRVAKVSRRDLMELVKTRCWLEAIALRESIARRDVVWEENLVLAFHRVSRTPRSSDQTSYAFNPDWERRHREFHLGLIAACDSRWLKNFCSQLNDQADRYRQLAALVSFPQRNERDEHQAILDAALDGDGDGAVELLCRHYSRTAEIILNSDFEFSEDDD